MEEKLRAPPPCVTRAGTERCAHTDEKPAVLSVTNEWGWRPARSRQFKNCLLNEGWNICEEGFNTVKELFIFKDSSPLALISLFPAHN